MKIKRLRRRNFLKCVGLASPMLFCKASAFAMGKTAAPTPSYLIKPERLRLGDTVGIVAPASPPDNPEDIDRYFEALKKLGFKPKLAPNIRKRLGFLAGDDEARARDLMAMFAGRDVKAIICLRGGYGSARLLRMLDYHFIKRHPKIFIGFSDITSLHCAFHTHARLVTFHGPTLNTSITNDKPSNFSIRSLMNTVMEPAAAGGICDDERGKTVSILRTGVATGRLVGGNLSVFAAAIGTPFQPRFRNNIFFFEDVDEQPYRFDEWLTQLLNAGLLQQAAGVAVGTNHNCTDREAANSKEYRQTVEDVIRERLSGLNVPIVTGLPFGHGRENATLPFGIRAKLDGETGDLIIIEPAVT